MKIVALSYNPFKDLVESKNLLAQYSESTTRYELFALEDNISWETSILKDTEDSTDFETNHKVNYNKPLEYRSTDGLPKIASAKFVENLSFWVDGTNGGCELNSGETKYIKKHFDVAYTLSGVDVQWFDSNWGDTLDLQVGVYTDENNEATFISLSQFADDFRIFKTGNRIFDVPTVKVIPPTVNIGGNDLNVYLRTQCVNVGPSASKVIVNFIGWK